MSLSRNGHAGSMSAFVRRIDDFGVSDLPQATERAFLDCQLDEDALHTTAVASAPGNTYVRPYLKGQKNDFRDAEAIAEAVQRPTMKFVATKKLLNSSTGPHRGENSGPGKDVAESLTSKPGIREQYRQILLQKSVASFFGG